jgi:ketosteroid isomerase-like protein
MRLLALLLALPLAAQSPEALANAERAFAHRATLVGTRNAFLAFFSEDAVIFRPQATPGRAYISQHIDDGSTLEWTPCYVEISGSADFGISTGPYAWTPRVPGATASWGHFLSVWAIRDGRWQVLLDIGVPHPKAPAPLLEGRRGLAPPLPLDKARRSLVDAEESLDQLAVTVPYPNALKEWGAPDLRVYRPGLPPSPGNLMLGCRYLPSRLTRVRRGMLMAPSGDLACTYGESDESTVTKEGQPKASRSNAVRVWRRERSGEWRLIVDLAAPIPDGVTNP